jgi:hypothetical protein
MFNQQTITPLYSANYAAQHAARKNEHNVSRDPNFHSEFVILILGEYWLAGLYTAYYP